MIGQHSQWRLSTKYNSQSINTINWYQVELKTPWDTRHYSTVLSGLTMSKNPLIMLLDKGISIIHHHQLQAADIHPSKSFTPTYGLTFASFTDDVGVVDKKTRKCKITQVTWMHTSSYRELYTTLAQNCKRVSCMTILDRIKKLNSLNSWLNLGTQWEKHQQCSCMLHIHTTALMSMRRSTYKDAFVSIE